jgi:GAF domain-containing protein/biotin carboxyl carrier protein
MPSHVRIAWSKVFRRPRLPFRAAAKVTIGSWTFPADTCNVSATGAQIMVDSDSAAHLPTGGRVLFNCSRGIGVGPIVAEALICWTRPNALNHHGDPRTAVGIAFHDLPPATRRALKNLELSARPTILVVGSVAAVVLRLLETDCHVTVALDGEAALATLDCCEIAAVLLGNELRGTAALDFLAAAVARFPLQRTRFVVLEGGEDVSLFQSFVDNDTVFFLAPRAFAPDDVAALVKSAAMNWSQAYRELPRRPFWAAMQIGHLRRVLDTLHHLAVQVTSESVVDVARDAVIRFVEADKSYCVVYDTLTQELCSRDCGIVSARYQSAAAGIVGFVARTGLPVHLASARQDPRYERDTDDPTGMGDERFLAVPVVNLGTGRALAVIVAIRNASRPEFAPEDADALALLAHHTGAALGRLRLQEEIEEAAISANSPVQVYPADMFRRQAVEHHLYGSDAGPMLLRPPKWLGWAYRLILAITLGAFGLAFVPITEYAPGSAVVKLDGLLEVTASTAGVVRSIDARPGQLLVAGDAIAQLHDDQESTDLAAIAHHRDVDSLAGSRAPHDRHTTVELTGMRVPRTQTEAQLCDRMIRTPQSGVVADVRVHVGDQVSRGDGIITLTTSRTTGYLVSSIPARYYRNLRPGQLLRFTIAGFPEAPQLLVVDSVGREVITQEEAIQSIGRPLPGERVPGEPLVIVRAPLTSLAFVADGKPYFYYNGTSGATAVRMRSRSLAMALVPTRKAAID